MQKYMEGDILIFPITCGCCGKTHGLRRKVLGATGDIYFMSDYWRIWGEACGKPSNDVDDKYKCWFDETNAKPRFKFGGVYTIYDLEELKVVLE